MVDKENIKKAFDDFENERFSNSSEILRKEIKTGINDFLKDKLDLKEVPLEIDSGE